MSKPKYKWMYWSERCPDCFANYRHKNHTCDDIMKWLVTNMKRVDPELYAEMLEEHKAQ